jgi:ABC-type microcin C transport system permease subunit YejE
MCAPSSIVKTYIVGRSKGTIIIILSNFLDQKKLGVFWKICVLFSIVSWNNLVNFLRENFVKNFTSL